MKAGKYGPGNTKFEKLTLSKVQFTHWDGVTYEKAGCGATALGLLTGKNPIEIATKAKKLPKGGRHFSDRFMVDFLRRNGFSVFEVNRANLTRDKIFSHKIQDNHLILYSSNTIKGEASFFVTYGGYLIHNFSVTRCNYLDLLSFPLLTCYVLHRPEWS